VEQSQPLADTAYTLLPQRAHLLLELMAVVLVLEKLVVVVVQVDILQVLLT
jgi:hypothetical protein